MDLKSIKNSMDSLDESKLKFTLASIGKSLTGLGLSILTLLGQLVIKLLFGFNRIVKKYPMAIVVPILIGWMITYVVMSWDYHSLQDQQSRIIMELQDSIKAAKLSGHVEGYRAKELEDISDANFKQQSKKVKIKAIQPKKVETPKIEKDPMEEVKVEPVKNQDNGNIHSEKSEN